MTEVKNLMQGLLDEIDRVREIQAEYKKVPGGAFADFMIEQDIEKAKEAAGIGDVVAMMLSYSKLKEYEL